MRTQLVGITIALVGLAAPIASAAPTIHYGPIVSRGATPDKMIVHWGTAASSDSPTVTYRVKGSATSMTATAVHGCANASTNCDYEATLPALTEGTEYEYAIAGNAIDGSLHFGTCPAAGSPLDVVFYGDSRSGGSVHQMVAGNVLTKGADIVFESGDIQYDGVYANYWSPTDTNNQPGFFIGAKSLVSTIPFMAVPGNHEHGSSFLVNTDITKNYELLFPNPGHPLGTGAGSGVDYYSFTCAGIMFIGLDGNNPDTTQQNFLKAQLAAAAGDATIKHVFAWLHQSPYSIGTNHGSETATRVFVSDFEVAANKVRAVFSGHDHNYQRELHNGLTYIVSGGAGADLYTLTAAPASGVTVEKSAEQYNFVKLHITSDFISGTAFDGQSAAPIETFTLYGSPSDMGGGGSGGGGGGGTGGTGGTGGGGGDGGTGGSGGGGSGGGGTGGNGNNGNASSGGCSIAGASNVGAPLLFTFALLGLVLRRRRRA